MSAHSNEQAATYFNIMCAIIESNYVVKCKNIKYLLNPSGYCTYLIQKQQFILKNKTSLSNSMYQFVQSAPYIHEAIKEHLKNRTESNICGLN